MLCCISILLIFIPADAHDLIKDNLVGSAIYYHMLPSQQSSTAQLDRDRALVRQLFNKSFRDIQVISQSLLREHEAGRLTSKRLAKDAKSINKAAKTLRSLMAFGELSKATEIDREIDTPAEFDGSIRKLANLIWGFAHSPIHQNTKVFNAEQAKRAQTDLLTIINLSKAIENKAKIYTFLPRATR